MVGYAKARFCDKVLRFILCEHATRCSKCGDDRRRCMLRKNESLPHHRSSEHDIENQTCGSVHSCAASSDELFIALGRSYLAIRKSRQYNSAHNVERIATRSNRRNMRTVGLSVLALCVAVGGCYGAAIPAPSAALPASAASAFTFFNESMDSSGNLVVHFKESGLSSGETVSYKLTALQAESYGCVDLRVATPVPTDFTRGTFPLSGTSGFTATNNGVVVGQLMAPVTVLNPNCAGNTTAVLVLIGYSNVLIQDTTNSISSFPVLPGISKRFFK